MNSSSSSTSKAHWLRTFTRKRSLEQKNTKGCLLMQLRYHRLQNREGQPPLIQENPNLSDYLISPQRKWLRSFIRAKEGEKHRHGCKNPVACKRETGKNPPFSGHQGCPAKIRVGSPQITLQKKNLLRF